MAPRKNKPAPRAAPAALTLTRIFDAPRALVYAAWTQPGHMKRWSAPEGFTLPESQGDLRPGGAWRAKMISPEGEEMRLGGEYREVVENERLVFTHSWEEDDGSRSPETVVTVRFADYGRKTKLTFTQTGFSTTDSRDGHEGGWSECFDRLKGLLAELQAAKNKPRKTTQPPGKRRNAA